MIKEKSKDRIGMPYFYELFLKRKRLFPIHFFLNPPETKKRKIPIEKRKFKSIITTYLDIYFGEFYYRNTPRYFLLSGELVKTKSKLRIIKGKEKRTINWIWYLRPTLSYFSNIRLCKLTGSTSKISILAKRYINNFDIEIITGTNSKIIQLRNSNKLFKNA